MDEQSRFVGFTRFILNLILWENSKGVRLVNHLYAAQRIGERLNPTHTPRRAKSICAIILHVSAID